MHHVRRVIALVLAATMVVALAACGSSSKKVGSAQEVLKETFGPDKPVRSGKLDLTLGFNSTGLQGLSGPISAKLTGPFQSKGGKSLPAFDFDLGLNAGGAAFSAGAVSTGSSGFVKFQGTTYKLPATFFSTFEKGYEQAAKKGSKAASKTPSFQTLGIDPRNWLSNPKKVGTENVGGTSTTHVSATVDVAKLLDDVDKLLRKAGTVAATGVVGLPSGLSAKQRADLIKAVKKATFDVWSGVSDGTLRRLLVKVSFAVPKAAQGSARGLRQGDLTIDLTLSDLNKPQTVSAPKNAHSSSELTAQLSQLLGGAIGGGSGSGAGAGAGSSGGSSSSAGGSAYLKCLGKAGADVSKVQACATLLGK